MIYQAHLQSTGEEFFPDEASPLESLVPAWVTSLWLHGWWSLLTLPSLYTLTTPETRRAWAIKTEFYAASWEMQERMTEIGEGQLSPSPTPHEGTSQSTGCILRALFWKGPFQEFICSNNNNG